MEDYKGGKLEVISSSSNNLEENLFKTYQLKGDDNQFYNLKMFLREKSIIFNIIIVNDFTEIIYLNNFTLEELYNLNRFFRQYLSIEELFKLFFKNIKEKDINIIKNGNKIKFNFFVLSRNKKEKVTFILNEEKIDLEKIVYKLCEKIKNIEKKFKLNQEKEKAKEKSKTFLIKFIESKIFLLFIFLFFFLINIIIIIYINKKEKDLNNLKNQIYEMKIFEKGLHFLIKEINNKFNNIIEQNSNNLNSEFNQIKNDLLINITKIKNDIIKLKNESYNITKKIKDMENIDHSQYYNYEMIINNKAMKK